MPLQHSRYCHSTFTDGETEAQEVKQYSMTHTLNASARTWASRLHHPTAFVLWKARLPSHNDCQCVHFQNLNYLSLKRWKQTKKLRRKAPTASKSKEESRLFCFRSKGKQKPKIKKQKWWDRIIPEGKQLPSPGLGRWSNTCIPSMLLGKCTTCILQAGRCERSKGAPLCSSLTSHPLLCYFHPNI